MSNKDNILEKGWSQMSNTLDVEMPVHKRKRPFMLIGLVGSFLLLGLLGVYSELTTQPIAGTTPLAEVVTLSNITRTLVSSSESNIPFELKVQKKEAVKSIIQQQQQQQQNISTQNSSIITETSFVIEEVVLETKTTILNNEVNKVMVLPISYLVYNQKDFSIVSLKERLSEYLSTDELEIIKLVKTRWGLKAGFVGSNIEEIPKLSAGLFYEIGHKNLFTSIGLSYDYKIGSHNYNDNFVLSGNNTHYVKVPLSLNYKLFTKASLNVGVEPYASYKISNDSNFDELNSFRVTDAIVKEKPTNFGCLATVGMNVNITDRFRVGLHYGYDFVRLKDISGSKHQATLNFNYYLK